MAYKNFIEPSVIKAGLHCVRDDQDLKSREISKGIFDKIKDANIVLCDLSGLNPHVTYELAMAMHCFRKKIVLIQDDISDSFFFTNQYFTYTYPHSLNPDVLDEHIEKLSTAITNTLNDKKHSSLIYTRRLTEEESNNRLIGQPIKRIITPVKFTANPKILIYHHKKGPLNEKEALRMKNSLSNYNIEATICEHSNPAPPDAIFISKKTTPKVFRITMEKLPYDPSFIFPVDYPYLECGVYSEFCMSIGLDSTHKSRVSSDLEKPYPFPQNKLFELANPTLNDSEFIHLLDNIAHARGSLN